MKLNKVQLFNSLSVSEHIRGMVGEVFETEMLYFTPSATYMVGKKSSVFTDSITARKELEKIADIFADDLDKGCLNLKINLIEPVGKKSYYSITIE